MKSLAKFFFIGLITNFSMYTGAVMAAEDAGVLKAIFVYPDEIATSPNEIRALCPQSSSQGLALGALATNIAVSLAGKAIESMIDAAAAKMQPQATTLDTTIPLAGFYDESGGIAISGGCLIFFNGSRAAPDKSSLLGSFVVVPSSDGSAFRFQVYKWKFTKFLKEKSSQWFQKTGTKDFILKIELLSPSSSGLGNRSVYVEHSFIAVNAETINTAFYQGQDLPWFASPNKPAGLPVSSPSGNAQNRFLPLNLRVTAIETSLPNQFAKWMQDIAKEQKTDVVTAVKDAVKSSLDPVYAATEKSKSIDSASTAYSAYKASWDEAALHLAAKPKDIEGTASSVQKEKYLADTTAWRAGLTVRAQIVATKMAVAKAAFSAADLPWPGDLPLTQSP